MILFYHICNVYFTSQRLFSQNYTENKIETVRATVVFLWFFFSLTKSYFLNLFAAYKLNLLMLQCIFVECLDCDCVSSYTSISGVYEITSPVTNNSTQVECVMKDGHGYTVSTTKVLVYKFCLYSHNICLQTGCTLLFNI